MKRLCLLISGLFALTGCGDQPPKSETFLRQVLDNLTVAVAYDEVCLDSKFVKQPNVLLFGNMQMIVYLYVGELKYNRPEASQQFVESMLLSRREMISGKAKKILEEKGCESDKAQEAKKLLDEFTTIHPAILMQHLDKKVRSFGGQLHIDSSKEPPQ